MYSSLRMPCILHLVVLASILSAAAAQNTTATPNQTDVAAAATGQDNIASPVLSAPTTSDDISPDTVVPTPQANLTRTESLNATPSANTAEQQQNADNRIAAPSSPLVPEPAAFDEDNPPITTTVDGDPLVEAASVPNEPISPEDAQLMHEQLQELIASEKTISAAGSELGVYQYIFDAHNQYKLRHQGSIYTWNPTLASAAAGWASRCTFGHDPNRNGGENIYATTSKDVAYALNNAITGWYKEVRDYDFSRGQVRSGLPSSTLVGHFTQVVWLGSSTIGCAAAICNYGIKNFQPGTIVVCRYAPAGNVIGQYVQNVRPATSTAAPPPPAATATPPTTYSSGGSSGSVLATVAARPGQDLQGPGCRSSPNQRYFLCVWDNGEAIYYDGQTPKWRTGTAGSGVGRPFKLVVWSNGNIYLDNSSNQFVWQSGSARGTPPHRLLLQDDGRLVLYDANSYVIWSVT